MIQISGGLLDTSTLPKVNGGKEIRDKFQAVAAEPDDKRF